MDLENALAEVRLSLERHLKFGAYSQEVIDECIGTLANFLSEMDSSNSKQVADQLIKQVVIKLNIMNEDADFSLIETDEREMIASIMNESSIKNNYSTEEWDVTEDFREW
jgi:hypothetical protein